MSDLIRKYDVRLIESSPDAYPEDWNEWYEKGFVDAINAVLDIPAVDAVEVKHGRWILHGSKHGDEPYWHTCSECGEEIWNPDIEREKFCWNCGARMDGKEGDT